MKYQNILVERDEAVAIVTLNRPKVLNALSSDLMRELDEAISLLEEDEGVGAIVFTGAGERAFSAGADIHEISRYADQGKTLPWEEHRDRYNWHLATCVKPTIGAINGLAFGGGALIASSFDIRIGCERTRFRFLGAVYGRVNSVWTLPVVVGMPAARDLLFTGREVHAEEAYRIGLLNQLVPSDRLMPAALEMARTISANNPRMVQGIKQLLIEGIGSSWEEMRRNEAEARSGRLKDVPVEESFRRFYDRRERRE